MSIADAIHNGWPTRRVDPQCSQYIQRGGTRGAERCSRNATHHFESDSTRGVCTQHARQHDLKGAPR